MPTALIWNVRLGRCGLSGELRWGLRRLGMLLSTAARSHKAAAEESKVRAAEHLTLEHLQTIAVPLDRAGAPGESDTGFDRGVVLREPGGEAAYGLHRTGGRALEPGIEALRLSLADQGGKVLGKVDGLGHLGMVGPQLHELLRLRANGHSSGGPWRQLQCTSCEGYFLETHGTLFHGKRVAVELIVRVLACLAEGLGIRSTARVFDVDPNTVLQWLVEAVEQLRAWSRYFLRDLHLTQVQVDELYALLSAVKEGEISEDEAIARLSRSPQWVWTAMDPQSKLLLTIDVGERTLAMAQ